MPWEVIQAGTLNQRLPAPTVLRTFSTTNSVRASESFVFPLGNAHAHYSDFFSILRCTSFTIISAAEP
jgi:hypothetical protein